MDAQAYLRKQGWRGDGHSLDHTGRGIKKPLLVSKKVDVLGVGLNKHAAVSDQWWLRAFDEGLKNFGTGKESTLAAVQKHGVNRGGLYARFVKGEGMPGTIEEDSEANDVAGGASMEGEASLNSDRKRKRKLEKERNRISKSILGTETALSVPNTSEESSSDSKLAVKTPPRSKRNQNPASSTITDSNDELDVRKLAPGKLIAYKARAKEKGVSLEEYVRRRAEKFATKHPTSKRKSTFR